MSCEERFSPSGSNPAEQLLRERVEALEQQLRQMVVLTAESSRDEALGEMAQELARLQEERDEAQRRAELKEEALGEMAQELARLQQKRDEAVVTATRCADVDFSIRDQVMLERSRVDDSVKRLRCDMQQLCTQLAETSGCHKQRIADLESQLVRERIEVMYLRERLAGAFPVLLSTPALPTTAARPDHTELLALKKRREERARKRELALAGADIQRTSETK